MVEDQIQLISMDLIDRPVKIARETIDPERVRELAESIREKGLLEAVLLRPSNGRFEIVFGDRRYLAHKLLNLKEIKATIRELDDRETIEIRGIENLQRVDLTASEEGRTYATLKEEGGLSTNEISRRTGKTIVTIRRYLNFYQCPDWVRTAVDRKQVSLSVLETLREIEDPDAFKYHFDMAAANGVTEKVARLWVDDYLKTQSGNFYNPDGSVPPDTLNDTPKPVFMTCEVCHGPTEIKKVRNMVVCSDCLNKVRHK